MMLDRTGWMVLALAGLLCMPGLLLAQTASTTSATPTLLKTIGQ